MASPTDKEIKAVMDDVEELDLPDGAHWCMIHDRLDLDYGDVFARITANPKFFGYTEEKPDASQ